MADEIQRPTFEELIGVTESKRCMTLNAIYLFKNGKQIGEVPIELTKLSKKNFKQIRFIEELVFTVEGKNLKPNEDDSELQGLSSELVLALRNGLVQRANAFDVIEYDEDCKYKLIQHNGQFELHQEIDVRMVGLVNFFRLNKSFFQERGEVIQSYKERYVLTNPTKSSSEPRP